MLDFEGLEREWKVERMSFRIGRRKRGSIVRDVALGLLCWSRGMTQESRCSSREDLLWQVLRVFLCLT